MTDENTELHDEYKRGWVDSVLLPYPLGRVEASESKYPEEYERGLKDGSEALAKALEARWEELSRIPPTGESIVNEEGSSESSPLPLVELANRLRRPQPLDEETNADYRKSTKCP